MNDQEELLRQTLAKVRDHIEPSPDLLEEIRVAVRRAERRRRLVATAVTVAVLVTTLVVLLVLANLRSGAAEDPQAQQHPSTAVSASAHQLPGGTNDEGDHDE